ncbi:MAG: hypothetical protein RLZZ249_1, partial [Actinomycetota bacterium]
PVVELRDAFGNRVPLAGVTVSAILHNPSSSDVVQKATLASAATGTLSSLVSDAMAALPVAQAVTDNTGTATFQDLAVVGIPGYSYQLRFEAATYLNSVPSTDFVLGTANPYELFIASQHAGSVTAGETTLSTYEVHLRDRFRNLITSNNSSAITMRVKVDANDANVGRGGVLIAPVGGSATLTFSAGVAQFSGFKLGGLVNTNYNFQFVAQSLGLLSNDSQTITLNAGAPVELKFSQSPTLVSVGEVFASDQRPVLKLVDQYGNLVTNANPINIQVTISPAAATVRIGSMPTLNNGIFDLSNLDVLGAPGVDHYLTFTPDSQTLSPITSPAFRILAGAPASINVVQAPVGGVTGQELAVQPGIEILDAAGNQANVTSSISFKVQLLHNNNVIEAGGASVPYLRVSSSDYVANSGRFDLFGIKVGGRTGEDFKIKISSTNLASTLSAETAVFRLTAEEASVISISRDIVAAAGDIASATRARFTTQPQLTLYDSFSNIVTTDSTTRIIAVLNSQNGELVGQRVATAQNGVVTFRDLGVRGPLTESYTVTFREASQSEYDYYVQADNTVTPVANGSSDLATATSELFTLNPGPAASFQLSIGLGNRQLSGDVASTQPQLRIFDQDGNLASTSAGVTVGVSITSGASGTLAGTQTATFVNGVATFTNLALAGLPNESYTVTYAAGGMTSVTQTGLFVNRTPTLTLGYQNQVYSAGKTVSPSVTTQSNGVLTYSVASASSEVCAVNATTGLVTILGAGSCQIDLAQAQENVSVSGEVRGSWLAVSTNTTFTIAKAEQSPIVSMISGSVTVSPTVGQSGPDTYRISTIFGTSLELSFAGGSVSSSPTFELTTSPQLAAVNQNIQPCIRVGTTLFPGNVQLVSGTPAAVCRVVVTLPGNANFNPVSTALDVVVTPTNQSTISMVSNPAVTFGSTQRLFTAGGNGTGALTFQVVTGQDKCRVVDVQGVPHVEGIGAGSCDIRALKDSSANYFSAQSATQSFVVSKANQFIRFTSVIPQAPKPKTDPSALAVNYEYAPTAVASSRLPVVISIGQEFDASGSPIVSACSFNGTKVTFEGPGRCLVVAQQAGGANFNAAPSVSQLIEVDRLNQTITFEDLVDRDFGDPAFQLTAESNAGLPVTFTQAPAFDRSICSVSETGLLTLGNAGVCEVFAIQPGNQTYRSAPMVKQRFSILPKPAAKPFITSVASTNEGLKLSFREPSYRGGSPITAYEVVATNVSTSDEVVSYACLPLDATPQFDSSGSPIVVPQGTVDCLIEGLTNGDEYTVKVAAITAYGAGEFSDVSQPVIPAPNFSAPQELRAISNATDAILNWSEPLALDGEFVRYDIFVRPVGVNEYTQLDSVSTFSASTSAIALEELPLKPLVDPSSSPSVSASVSASAVPAFNAPQVRLFGYQPMPFAMPFVNQPMMVAPRFLNVQAPAQMVMANTYEFMIITVTDVTSTSNSINTAMVQQQLLSRPSAPSTLSAEPQGRDMFIAWAGSVFDGGSSIIDYTVKVNGSTVTVSPTPSTAIFANWQYSTTYNVEVLARNEIGYSQPTTFVLTTPEDPTPPPSSQSLAAEVFEKMPQMYSFTPNVAQPGSLVTVDGYKLDRIKSLKLGNRAVEYRVISDKKLVFKIPTDTVAGVYAVEHFSEWGRVIVQDALTVAGSPVNEDFDPVTPVDPTNPTDPTDPDTEEPRDPDDVDGDGQGTNEDSDIDGDGIVNGDDSDIDGDTINNPRDPNPVVPNDPSEALPGDDDSTESNATDGGSDSQSGGLLQTDPGSAWLLILLMAIAAAIGAFPASAAWRARRKDKQKN